MTSGEIVALCLACKDGIEQWKKTMGPSDVREAMKEAPNSLRARYGNPEAPEMRNALHGSDSSGNPEPSKRMSNSGGTNPPNLCAAESESLAILCEICANPIQI
jgi:hypothetical protein